VSASNLCFSYGERKLACVIVMDNNRKDATTAISAGDNHNNNNDVTSTRMVTISLNTY